MTFVKSTICLLIFVASEINCAAHRFSPASQTANSPPTNPKVELFFSLLRENKPEAALDLDVNDDEIFPELVRLLQSDNVRLAFYARSFLGMMKDEKVIKPLMETVDRDPDAIYEKSMRYTIDRRLNSVFAKENIVHIVYPETIAWGANVSWAAKSDDPAYDSAIEYFRRIEATYDKWRAMQTPPPPKAKSKTTQ